MITEEYESSIQIFATVLEYLGVPMDIIRGQKEEMRWNSYGALSRLRKTRDESNQSNDQDAE